MWDRKRGEKKTTGWATLHHTPCHREVASCLTGMLNSSGAFVAYPSLEKLHGRLSQYTKGPIMIKAGIGTREICGEDIEVTWHAVASGEGSRLKSGRCCQSSTWWQCIFERFECRSLSAAGGRKTEPSKASCKRSCTSFAAARHLEGARSCSALDVVMNTVLLAAKLGAL